MKKLCRILFPIYLYCVLHITLLNRNASARRMNLIPFWEFQQFLNSRNKSYWFGQMFGNLIMLFPLGFMLPFISRKFEKFPILFVMALLCTLLIEITQYFTGRGLMELDDIFHNTFGAVMGYAVWKAGFSHQNRK